MKASTLESTELATTIASTPGRGRPSIYTPQLAADICLRLAEGQSLLEICRDPEMPCRGTIMDWVLADLHGFSKQYTRARELQYEHWADEITVIADDASNDYMDRQTEEDGVPRIGFNAEHVNRSRLRIETRRWMLSKLKPAVYGDQIKVEHSGTVGVLSVAEILRQREDAVKAQAEAALTIDTSAEVQG